jgi:hypothetical protein
MPYAKPTIINKALTLANTEYSQALPNDSKKILVASRSFGNLKFAFVSGESATNYISVKAGSSGVWIDAILIYGQTLYIQSDVAGDVAEILIFV